MKLTARQTKLYLNGKLRIVTNPHTKESKLVRVTKPFAHDKGKTNQLRRAYYKLRRLSALEKSRSKKREYMRRCRSLELLQPELELKKTRRVRTAKPEVVQAPRSLLQRLLEWCLG